MRRLNGTVRPTMAASKRKTSTVHKSKKKVSKDVDQYQPGMPAQDSITGVDTYKKGGKRFQIIHTNEVDEYELPATPSKPTKKRAKSP